MTFYLAFRSIIRNKKNSLLIVLLVAAITFLFFIGNSVIGRADQSIRAAYIASLTGDVVIQQAGEVTMNLFGGNTPIIDSYFAMPVLPAYDAVMKIVSAQAGVAGITSQVSGRAYLDMLGVREPVLLCGVDAASYFPLFPGIVVDEGRFLRSGEYGAMITSERADRIASQSGERPVIGTPLLLTAGGGVGFKIREVPLVGIYHYQNPGQFMNEIIIIDPQTVRVLNSIQVASVEVEVDGAALSLLDAGIDELFEMDTVSVSANGTEHSEFSADMLQSFLRETSFDQTEELAGGDWNFIILRLEKSASPGAFIAALNKTLGPYGVRADGWRTAAGTSAILMLFIQSGFNGGVFLVSVAGILTAVNILLISVFRRTREIGTLKAIGASDGYIRLLILGENLVLAFAAGFVGVMGGGLFLRWINRMDLVISNDLIAALLGGHVLKVEALPHIAVLSFAVAAALGFFASIYPVETAVRIEPISAVRRG